MLQAIAALATSAFLLLGSPGPAPMALAAVGAAHGVRQGSAFWAGTLAGLLLSIIGASAGLATLFALFPKVKFLFQILGGIYIIYIAIKIAIAPVDTDEGDERAPPTFVDGMLLNILNPKSYAVFIAIFSRFLLPADHPSIAYAATSAICLGIAVVTNFLWLCFGGLLKPIFRRPLSARIVRIIFAAAMMAAVAWAFF